MQSWLETQAEARHCQEPVPLWEGAGPLALLQEACEGQSARLGWPFSSRYFARSLRPCRSLSPPTLMADAVILLDLGTRMPWLASKKENYFLSSLHTPVAFNWMQSILSSFPRQTLECGLG